MALTSGDACQTTVHCMVVSNRSTSTIFAGERVILQPAGDDESHRLCRIKALSISGQVYR